MCGLSSWDVCNGEDWPPALLTGLLILPTMLTLSCQYKQIENLTLKLPYRRSNQLCSLSVMNMKIDVSWTPLNYLTVTITGPCIEWKLVSERLENLELLLYLQGYLYCPLCWPCLVSRNTAKIYLWSSLTEGPTNSVAWVSWTWKLMFREPP